MNFDLNAIRDNVKKAETEDLLDRITAYRAGMEPAAIEVIEAELDHRGVGPEQIHEHAEKRAGVLMVGGVAQRCSYCDRPAIGRRWVWHRMEVVFPLYRPRLVSFCEVHRR
jgi:hypothetical protein